jgi:GTP-binding protein
LKIKRVEFAGAMGRPDQAPPGTLPQIAFSGRSNVGKSSLINRVIGRTRKELARVSSTPGKTQEINFYQVLAEGAAGADVRFFLVDLPGYGFAKAPAEQRRKWRPLIEGYLGGAHDLRGVVQLIDVRRGPTPDDLVMMEYLTATGLPTLFAVTKVDKLKSNERVRQMPAVAAALGVDMDQVVPFSALTGEGTEDLLDSIMDLLGNEDES